MKKVFKKMVKNMSSKNVYDIWDKTEKELHEIAEGKINVENIKMEDFDVQFDYETGELEYVLFKDKVNDQSMIRILRLFRVVEIPALIRSKMNGEKAFRDILKDFQDGSVSFVKLDAFKPGEDTVFCYGLLKEGKVEEKERLLKETKRQEKTLRAQFKSAYDNVKLASLTLEENWIFLENFGFQKLFMTRGIPRKDSGMGRQTGSDVYGMHPQSEEESEIFYKGMTSGKRGEHEAGDAYLVLSIFDMLDPEHIHFLLRKNQDIFDRLQSSIRHGIMENHSAGLPIMMGLGMGLGEGTVYQEGVGHNHMEGTADGSNTMKASTEMSGETKATASGVTQGMNQGTSETNGTTNGTNKGTSAGTGFLPFVDVNGSMGWSNSENFTNGTTYGTSSAESNQTSLGTSTQNGSSTGSGTSHTVSSAQGTSNSVSNGSTTSNSQNASLAGGANLSQGLGSSREGYNSMVEVALEMVVGLQSMRLREAENIGMFTSRTFVLTKDEESKDKAMALWKQAYLDENTPFPTHIQNFEGETERNMIRYAKMMKKTNIKEKRPCLLENDRFETYLTPSEMTAFGPIATNRLGFTTSHEPIPQAIRMPGKMTTGAFLGHQLDTVLNEVRDQKYFLNFPPFSHMLVSGNTGVGKTVFTKRLAVEMHNVYDANVIVFDWAQDYRSAINYIKNPNKYRLFTFDPSFMTTRINLIAPPKNVPKDVWSSTVAQLFCFAFGLGGRSLLIITDIMRSLIGAMPNPTIKDLAYKIEEEYQDRMEKSGNKMDFNEKATFSSMKDRFKLWLKEDSIVYQSMCAKGNFLNIEELIEGECFRVFECSHLPEEVIPFVVNGISAAIFHYCEHNRKVLRKPTYTFFEEAHTILQEPSGNEPLAIKETIFEKINRISRKYNLFTVYICQNPEEMPPALYNRIPVQMTLNIQSDEGRQLFVASAGRDPIRKDRNLVDFISRMPRGMVLIRQGIFDHGDMTKGELTAFMAAPLPMDTDHISNDVFKSLYAKKVKAVH